MKKVIIAMIIIVILIIITICALLFTLKHEEPETENVEGDVGLEINFKETVTEPVTDNISFFTIQNCIQGYINALNLRSSSYYDDNGNQIVSVNEIATNIYNLLSQEYIDEKSVTTSNIFNYVDKTGQNLIFVPLKMNYLLLQSNTKYAVQGFCIDWDNKYVKDVYFIINVDDKNKTYSITPLEADKYKSINDIELNRNEITIEAHENNIIKNQNITDQYLCEQYLLIQKRLMLSKQELSYDYLDEEYKNERFGNLQNYLKYISENKAHISKISLREYEVQRIGDKTNYMCKDQYGNYYLFNTKNVLNYKVLLDIYTIEQEKAIETYAKYSNAQKVAYNANKIVQMINNKDYQGIYDILNSTFRSNNWNSIEKFENYIKNKYPSYYEIQYGNSEQNGESYIQTLTLKDIDKKEQDKNLTLIIKLQEEMKFEMSIAL